MKLYSLTLAAFFFFVAGAAFASPLSFNSATAPSIGAVRVVQGDFNRDGKIDLLSADINNNLVVLLNNGNGGFTSNSSVSFPSTLVSLAAEDMNLDGKLDAVAVYNSGATAFIKVLTNNGAGQLTVWSTLSPPFSVAYVGIADINNDGKPDVVAVGTSTSTGGGYMVAYTNNGSGFLVAGTNLFGSNPQWIALGDMNNDGKIDAVVSDYIGNSVRVLTNSGTGIFAAYTTNSGFVGASALTLADVNNDGKLDIACVGGPGLGTMLVLTNSGSAFSVYSSNNVGGTLSQVIAADLHHNKKLDLACLNTSANSLVVFTNSGTGFGTNTVLSSGIGMSFVLAADVNNDSKLDLVIADQSDYVQVLTQNGGNNVLLGYVSSTTPAGSAGFSEAFAEAAADINNDGKTDLVNALGSDYVSTLNNLGNLNFGVLVNNTFPGARIITTGDLNHDGKIDAVVADASSNIVVMLNNGSGVLVSNNVANIPFLIQTLAVGDMNVDGRLDVVAGYNASGSGVIKVLTNNGAGQLTGWSTINLPFLLSHVEVADLNNDGKSDVIVVGAGSMSAYTNSGSGFLQAGTTNFGTSLQWVALGDVNNDGKIDAVVSDYVGNSVRVFTNSGNAVFSAFSTISGLVGVTGLALADVNNDGKLDIACIDTAGFGSIIVLTNSGSSFSPFWTNNYGASITGLIAADLSGNGNPVLVTANGGTATLNLLSPLWIDLETTPAPKLFGALDGTSQFNLSWTAYDPTYVVSGSSNLTGWAPTGVSILRSNLTNFSATVPLSTSSNRFFRLSH